MLRPLILVLASAGCADPWEEARAACDFAEGETLAWELLYTADDGGLNGLPVSTGCGETLIEAVGGDPAALLDEIGADPDLATHLDDVRLGEAEIDGVTVLVWGLYWLVGGDFGTVGALEADPYLSQGWVDRFRDEAAAVGVDEDGPLAKVLYDAVATRTASLSWLPEDAPIEASMGMRSWPADSLHLPRVLDEDLAWAFPPWSPLTSAAGLVHEAYHASLAGIPHVECEPPANQDGRVCDEDLDGTYGATFATLWVSARAARGGSDCIVWDDSYGPRITYDAELQIRTTWPEMLMAEMPESPVTGCE